jgi:tRNA uridine 5-carboxymethylaminomethyl modification enzyme
MGGSSASYPGAWDVIVVGGGHAGVEATLALARCGRRVLLLTQAVDRIGWMSCNPSIGGVGKTHLVAELDALGGMMARLADAAAVHVKLLNASRGPAVQALRAQCDKLAYATASRTTVESTPGVSVKQATVERLWLQDGALRGVTTQHGVRFEARAVVLTAGTFMAGVLHTGDRQVRGGRAGEAATTGLGAWLRAEGVQTRRHKTGTCPRLDRRTIDYDAVDLDPGLDPPPPMARVAPALHERADVAPARRLRQMPCFATETNERTHALIRRSLDRSPMFTGAIEGVGPRYCPSIEDKVVRFADRPSHTLYLEREGWQTGEVYLSGLSTSLPPDAQVEVVRSIRGLQRAELVRYGYAVEYDVIDARQLRADLSLPVVGGLFLAGQVNGTSGYEEAAAQGLVAALGAERWLAGEAPFVFDRSESYLGVLVDDLVGHGGDEPYRMLTSRAEHRLQLRTGNAEARLSAIGRELGLLDDPTWARVQARLDAMARAREALEATTITPTPANQSAIAALGAGGLDKPTTLAALLGRPGLTLDDLRTWWPAALAELLDETLDGVARGELATEQRYAGYIARAEQRRRKLARLRKMRLPGACDWTTVPGVSAEAAAALQRRRPEDLGAASRLPGVTPGAVAAIAVWLEGRRRV